MFDIKEKVEEAVDDIEEIANTYYRLTTVRFVDKVSKLGSGFLVLAVAIGLVFFIVLFVGFAASYWIGRVLNDTMLGFFIVAGFYILLLLLLIVLRKKVIQPFIRNIIIKNLYD